MAENKKAKHKDYEKNRRLKLNEELRANDVSNDLLERCVESESAATSGAVLESAQSSEDERSDDEGEPANKRVVLQQTRNQLQALCEDSEDYPALYRSPADMERLALSHLDGCLVLRFDAASGRVEWLAGEVEALLGARPDDERPLWSFVPERQRATTAGLFAVVAERSADGEAFRTLLPLQHAASGWCSSFLADGRFLHAPDGRRLFCGILVEEGGDRLYDECCALLSVDLHGVVTGAEAECEPLFERSPEQLCGAALKDVLRCQREEDDCELVFRYFVQQLVAGDVDPEETATLWLPGFFQVVDVAGGTLPARFRAAIKPIANPVEYDTFQLIGTNLLLFDSEFVPEVAGSEEDNDQDVMQRAMSWSNT